MAEYRSKLGCTHNGNAGAAVTRVGTLAIVGKIARVFCCRPNPVAPGGIAARDVVVTQIVGSASAVHVSALVNGSVDRDLCTVERENP